MLFYDGVIVVEDLFSRSGMIFVLQVANVINTAVILVDVTAVL